MLKPRSVTTQPQRQPELDRNNAVYQVLGHSRSEVVVIASSSSRLFHVTVLMVWIFTQLEKGCYTPRFHDLVK